MLSQLGRRAKYKFGVKLRGPSKTFMGGEEINFYIFQPSFFNLFPLYILKLIKLLTLSSEWSIMLLPKFIINFSDKENISYSVTTSQSRILLVFPSEE